MVDITLSREAGRTCSLDLRENSVNYEVQLDAQRRNFMMATTTQGRSILPSGLTMLALGIRCSLPTAGEAAFYWTVRNTSPSRIPWLC